jgi:hypothetical protein
MKLLVLGNGMTTQVDDEDFEMLSKWTWTAHYKRSGNWYAERNNKGKTLAIHRQIMNPPPGVCVDHIDRDTLNNQRSNLRFATRAQNNANRSSSRSKSTCTFLGVTFEKERVSAKKKWVARIRKDGKRYRLGRFATAVEAADAYNNAAIRLHGEFASLNVLS